MHIQDPDIVRTVYSSIFKDIQAYSGILIHPGTQLGKSGEASSSLFENQKKSSDPP